MKKSTREQRFEQGFCRCGGVREEGKKSCTKCLTMSREASHRCEALRRSRGQCSCGAVSEIGKRECEKCLANGLATTNRHYAKNIALGLCGTCGKPAEPGRKQCRKCLDGRMRIRKERSDDGRCGICNAPVCERSKVHCERHRVQSLEKSKRSYSILRATVLAHYGQRCSCCGETTAEFLTVEHLNGGGGKHRKEVGGGAGVYRWIIRHGFPASITVLCWNCNCAKRFGICPHETKRREAMAPANGPI